MKTGKVMVTGASGTLGRHIVESGLFGDIVAPSHSEMDITDADSVEKFLGENQFDTIIHCAAMARMGECEKEPKKAILTNAIGTTHLVTATIKKEAEEGRKIRFVHISTDGVYQSTKGNYSEKDETAPYNHYGWTKLGAESAVNLLQNFCIIRTRFFDPKNIKYDAYATDSYTSMIPANELAQAIAVVMKSGFVGTINIGGEKVSDYDAFRKHKPSIRPCKLQDIQSKTPFKLPKDASMKKSLWNRIKAT